MSSYSLILKNVSIYIGIPMLIIGCLGSLLNLIVFLSLKTFRENSCGFYLIIMSLVNFGQLQIGLLTRILINGYSIDYTLTNRFQCKLIQYLNQFFALISLTCLCLSTIDQYFSTHIRQRYQQMSHIQISYRLIILTILFWLIHGIPYLIYFDHRQSIITGNIRCTIINERFSQYYIYFYTVVLTGYLPVFITIFFGFLAYKNVREISYRTIPIVRRELDKQLTTMVLIFDLFNILTLLAYPIIFTINFFLNIRNDRIISSKMNFLTNLTFYFYYLYFSCPFYIFVCVSERFRRQLIYVIFQIHIERWRRHRMIAALVLPR